MHKFMAVSNTKPVETISTQDKLELIKKTLKAHYELDLESICAYWGKFGSSGGLKRENFYNENIIIEDKYKEFQDTFDNFDQLFAINVKRWIICANEGYGKSTLVWEMVRQWVKDENNWTRKFLFLFLFKLEGVKKEQRQSIRGLLMNCGLDSMDADFVSKMLEDDEFVKKCLFVFDGSDELQEGFGEEMESFILGLKCAHANIVITSKPWWKLQEYQTDANPSVFIELAGYTDKGIVLQLQKHKISCETTDDMRDMLKVPLFNTLFCVMHQHLTCPLTMCTAIESFVQYAFNRYRISSEGFTIAEENEVKLILGQVAQSQFKFIAKPELKSIWSFLDQLGIITTEVKYPIIPSHILSISLNAGLIYQKANGELMFPHQTIAEYFAAYFWCNAVPSKIKQILNSEQTFSKPAGSSYFSCFFGQFNREYKEKIWQMFETVIPFLDEYETLPKRHLNQTEINLSRVPVSQQNSAMDKIEFGRETSEEKYFLLSNASFVNGKTFGKLTNMPQLYLHACSFNVSPEDFFAAYKIKKLAFDDCTCNDKITEIAVNLKGVIVLEELEVCLCNFTMVKFLSYIVKTCATLKSFQLKNSFQGYPHREKKLALGTDDYFGIGWIEDFQNNEKLLHSIEECLIWCADPDDLSLLFETLGKMVNLKKLELEVCTRNLKKSEKEALTMSLENGLSNLQDLKINVKDEYDRDILITKSQTL